MTVELLVPITSARLEASFPGTLLHLTKGITLGQIDQLVTFTANDPEIARQTGDLGRFLSPDSFEKWLNSGVNRRLYTLTDPDENLHGLGWVGLKPIPDSYTLPGDFDKNRFPATAALRLYDEMRGMGLATDMNLRMLENYAATQLGRGTPPQKPYGIWCEILATNQASIGMSTKTGYGYIATSNDGSHILMGI